MNGTELMIKNLRLKLEINCLREELKEKEKNYNELKKIYGKVYEENILLQNIVKLKNHEIKSAIIHNNSLDITLYMLKDICDIKGYDFDRNFERLKIQCDELKKQSLKIEKNVYDIIRTIAEFIEKRVENNNE